MNYPDPLSWFIAALTDARKSIITKAFIFLGVVGLMIFLNNQVGFSYFYYHTYKLEQVEKINSILDNNSLENEERIYLKDLRSEILFKRPWTSHLYGRVSNYDLEFSNDQKVVEQLEKDLTTAASRKPIDPSWHYLSTNWFLLLTMVILIPLETRKEYMRTGKLAGSIFAFFTMEIFFIFLSWVLSYGLSFIPRFSYEVWPTYLLNGIIGFGFLLVPLLIIGLAVKK